MSRLNATMLSLFRRQEFLRKTATRFISSTTNARVSKRQWRGAFQAGLAAITIGLWVASAQTNFTALVSFGTRALPGANCVAELHEASDGALYGTSGGGSGAGIVFKVKKDGTGGQTLHTFGTGAGDGGTPMAGVVEGSNGIMYGTTAYGGTSAGLGTVYKINKDGSGYVILHRFGAVNSDGKYASGRLTAVGRVFYGTTWAGGTADLGTIFKINDDGTGYAVVYSFNGGKYLAAPQRGVIRGSDGALYGVTAYGSNSVAGAVFKINLDGSGYTLLRNFRETGQDAKAPWALLVEGSDGNLYGATREGGAYAFGTLFTLGKQGTDYRILHSFTNNSGDGGQPNGLIEGDDGALYGTTTSGGNYQGGTAFKVNKDGSSYAILRHFRNGSETGWHPAADLVQGSDDGFYGTTYYSMGDGLGPGVVFALFVQPRSWFTGWTVESNGLTALNAHATADTVFSLQAATTPAGSNWQVVATDLAGTLGTLNFTNLPTGQPQRFYRLIGP